VHDLVVVLELELSIAKAYHKKPEAEMWAGID
jgi:hypothetical protein